jgi:hypothetical protein
VSVDGEAVGMPPGGRPGEGQALLARFGSAVDNFDFLRFFFVLLHRLSAVFKAEYRHGLGRISTKFLHESLQHLPYYS